MSLLTCCTVAVNIIANDFGGVILSTCQVSQETGGSQWIAMVWVPIWVFSKYDVEYSPMARDPVHCCRVRTALCWCRDIDGSAGNCGKKVIICQLSLTRKRRFLISRRSQYAPVWAASTNSLSVEQLSLEATIHTLSCSPHGTLVISQVLFAEEQW